MKGVVTFGEVMMRLSCPGHGRLRQARSFDVLYVGSEASVASSLALSGVPAAHVTCLPDDDLGAAAAGTLAHYSVDTSHIVFRKGRIGVFFLEYGASIRAPKIIYDRFESVFARLDPGEFDWNSILRNARWFHWSGITPAISAEAAQACLQAVRTASSMGITVSGDINYRRNLWQYGKSPREIMPELIRHSNVLVAGITDFENCLGIARETWEETCRRVVSEYPNVSRVIATSRKTLTASHNILSGMLWDGRRKLATREFDLQPIVDRVGAGDAFMAGFIFASIAGKSDQEIIDYATAAGAMKHTIEGDVNVASVKEITALLEGDNIGKLLR